MTALPRPVTPLGILAERLEKLVQQTEGNTQIPADMAKALAECHQLAAGLDPYLESCTTAASPALVALAEKTRAEDWSKCFTDGKTVQQLEQEMLSGHVEGQLLKMIVHMTRAEYILDIGMFTGYSALAMAEALPESGRLIACEVDDYVADFARNCFRASPHGSKISIAVGPALETMHKLADAGNCFDLVFIDANKCEYWDYFQLLLDRNLLAANGFMCVDNTLLQGQAYLDKAHRSPNGEAIADFNQRVAADKQVEQVLLPLRDGVTLIRRI